ncbi:MAG: hypothetical protein U1C33_01405, partial [Candidatus Cloacimonadaceae bacterium]|nr:hypothetical protein [Candidatus Cloacimonadaceae bacterium]
MLFGTNSFLNQQGGSIKLGWNFQANAPNSFQASSGTIEFIGNRFAQISSASGNYFHDLRINKASLSNQVMLATDVVVNNDLFMVGGNLTVSSRSLTVSRDLIISGGRLSGNEAADLIKVGRNWQNTVGSSAFAEGSGTVEFFSGQNAYIGSETFNHLRINKPSSQSQLARIAASNSVAVKGNLSVLSGCLVPMGDTVLDVTGNVTISSGAGIRLLADGALLPSLLLSGNLTDNNTSWGLYFSFNATEASNFILKGSTDQNLNSSSTFLNVFNMTVDKPGGGIYVNKSLDARGKLHIVRGFYASSTTNRIKYVYGDFIVESAGMFTDSTGEVQLRGASDTYLRIEGQFYTPTITIQKNNSNRKIIATGSVNLWDNTILTMNNGIFELSPGSILRLRHGSSINVGAATKFMALGSAA